MGDIVQQTVNGLSIAILLVLVVLVFGYSHAADDDDDDDGDPHRSSNPFGCHSKLFWNIFVTLTVTVLLAVLFVSSLSLGGRTQPPSVVVWTDSAAPTTSSSSPLGISSFSTLGGSRLTTLSSLDSFSSADISTSLGALSDSLSSSVSQSL